MKIIKRPGAGPADITIATEEITGVLPNPISDPVSCALQATGRGIDILPERIV